MSAKWDYHKRKKKLFFFQLSTQLLDWQGYFSLSLFISFSTNLVPWECPFYERKQHQVVAL